MSPEGKRLSLGTHTYFPASGGPVASAGLYVQVCVDRWRWVGVAVIIRLSVSRGSTGGVSGVVLSTPQRPRAPQLTV